MKKLLIIAPYFLPRRRVGAQRPFKFAINLQHYGWKPHVLTLAADGELTEKERQLLTDIPIYRIKPPFDRTVHSGGGQTKAKKRSKEGRFSVSEWIDRHFPVDTWLPLFWLQFRNIKHIVQEVNPDAIWSTGDPWSAHWVGKKISDLRPNTFWMADFRDPWTLTETDLRKRSLLSAWIDRHLERSWIRKVSMLSFTSNTTRNLYEQHYSDIPLKSTTIYNSFSRDLLDYEGNEPPALNIDAEKLNLMFFGRFRRLSSAKPVIDILEKLQQINPEAITKIAVHSFGPLTESDQNYLKARGLEEAFVSQALVPQQQGQQVLQQADVLLLSTNPERTDIIPAKLWDYLPVGRPILSLAPNPEIKTIIDETGTGVQFEPNETAKIAGLLSDAIEAKRKGAKLPIPFSRDEDKIDVYSAKAATQKLATILDLHTK